MNEEMGKEKEAALCLSKARWLCLILGATVTLCGYVLHIMGMSVGQFIGLVFFMCVLGALFWFFDRRFHRRLDLLETERWRLGECVGVALLLGLPVVTCVIAAVGIIVNKPLLGSLIVGGVGLFIYFAFSLPEKKDEGHE